MSARAVFDACCQGIESSERKGRLLPSATKVELAADDYAAAGEAGTIEALKAATYEPLEPATVDDFVWLYEQRLVDSVPGRMFYELLRDGNRDGRCALCNAAPAWTLDHHLPKADHPIFAVTPDNLLPACRDCNSKKLKNPTSILNTYFDDLGASPWLQVTLRPGRPWIPEYSLQIQSTWSSELAERAQEHFNLLKLREFYAYQAIRHASGIRHHLEHLLETEGVLGVRQYLERSGESWNRADPNSWEAALYAGLIASDWFCSGGFSQ